MTSRNKLICLARAKGWELEWNANEELNAVRLFSLSQDIWMTGFTIFTSIAFFPNPQAALNSILAQPQEDNDRSRQTHLPR